MAIEFDYHLEVHHSRYEWGILRACDLVSCFKNQISMYASISSPAFAFNKEAEREIKMEKSK